MDVRSPSSQPVFTIPEDLSERIKMRKATMGKYLVNASYSSGSRYC